ncbi:Diacylglycerol kinase-related protein [Serinicoccus hydrothermalis]|uniref:Diacylglycerol kinase-related protein n=1 Tax=Serinicoccus hydrothermalis TaxID=1758689 RepID=A0A1B1N8H8_9MICO|nr:diacylglycerol kinase family protein [Serinicoccus hydrothermalis]ANS77740.1 Diacylglycerol kinase-related protein [Serinicoccus hydrothermalis]
MRYALAHGRRSGRRGGAAVGEQAVRRLRDAGHEVVEVVGDTLDQVRAACGALVADGVDVLAVAGGDGLVSLGTDLCAGTGTALGILPAGTGNDNARSLGLPRDPAAAVEVLLTGTPRAVDTLHVRELDRRVLGSVCCALDARINDRANRWPRWVGPGGYTLSALVEIALLRRQPPLHYRLEVDGRPTELDALVVVAATMPYLGGGLPLAPDADPADGLLDLVVVTPVAPREAVGLLRAIRAGRHTSHHAVHLTRAREVVVHGPPDITAHGDGEPLGPLPLDVRVDAASLRVLTTG